MDQFYNPATGLMIDASGTVFMPQVMNNARTRSGGLASQLTPYQQNGQYHSHVDYAAPLYPVGPFHHSNIQRNMNPTPSQISGSTLQDPSNQGDGDSQACAPGLDSEQYAWIHFFYQKQPNPSLEQTNALVHLLETLYGKVPEQALYNAFNQRQPDGLQPPQGHNGIQTTEGPTAPTDSPGTNASNNVGNTVPAQFRSTAETITPPKTRDKTRMKCPYHNCDQGYTSWSQWTIHKKSHWPTKYGCLICSLHINKTSYTCKSCNKGFTRLPSQSETQGALTVEELKQAKTHLQGCGKLHEAIRNRKSGWWEDKSKLAAHLKKNHNHSGAADFRSASTKQDAQAACMIVLLFDEQICKVCNRTLASPDLLEKHFSECHLNHRDSKSHGMTEQKQQQQDHEVSHTGFEANPSIHRGSDGQVDLDVHLED